MATNLFSRASAYRKKHPHLTQAEAVSALSKQDKKKPAHKKKTAKKKPAARKKAAAPRKKKASVGKVRRHKKTAKKKTAARKTPAAPTHRTRKVKIKIKKSGMPYMTIGAASMGKIHTEHSHQNALKTAIAKHQALAKTKGMTAGEKARIKREIQQYKDQLAASKKHVTVLKKSI